MPIHPDKSKYMTHAQVCVCLIPVYDMYCIWHLTQVYVCMQLSTNSALLEPKAIAPKSMRMTIRDTDIGIANTRLAGFGLLSGRFSFFPQWLFMGKGFTK
jgi:hypothetical protein